MLEATLCGNPDFECQKQMVFLPFLYDRIRPQPVLLYGLL